jgi:2',3'-cyclic-nucleotide 2'-phosphodiesterase (5'-nucleotidase family)
VVSEFNNLLKFDATTLGNHEFDDKIAGLVPFMKVTRHHAARSSVQ